MGMGIGFMELLIVAAVIAATAFFFRLILWSPKGRDEGDRYGHEGPASETEMLRELHQGLLRMEKRIEALETLLLDREEARRAAATEKRP